MCNEKRALRCIRRAKAHVSTAIFRVGPSEQGLRMDGSRIISEGVRFDQITVLTLRIRPDTPKQTVYRLDAAV